MKSKEEVIEWLKRPPFDAAGIELRPLCEAEDLGPALTPELREQGKRIRAQMIARQLGRVL